MVNGVRAVDSLGQSDHVLLELEILRKGEIK